MSKIDKIINPIVNTVISGIKPSAIVKNAGVSSPIQSALQSLQVDRFEKCIKSISVEEVKKLFPTGKLDENNYIVYSIKDVLGRIKPTPAKSIDLSAELTQEDYELITKMMNVSGGKFIDLWKGFSNTDLIPNIQKLALFVRSMKLSKQADEFLKFNPVQWDIVVDGIIKKPKEAIIPLLEYKVNSDEINKALSSGIITPEIQRKIDAITNYLNLFETKQDMTVYRGEKSFGLFKTITPSADVNLSDVLNFFDNAIAKHSFNNNNLKYANNLINALITNLEIKQPRFLSTAMSTKSADKYAEKVYWKIKIPMAIKGASIESFNIEREAEAEFLLQKGSFIKVNKACYNIFRKLWEFEAEIRQFF